MGVHILLTMLCIQNLKTGYKDINYWAMNIMWGLRHSESSCKVNASNVKELEAICYKDIVQFYIKTDQKPKAGTDIH